MARGDVNATELGGKNSSEQRNRNGSEHRATDGTIKNDAKKDSHEDEARQHEATTQEHGGDGMSKEPGKLRQVIEKAGLDLPTLMMMFKASLPPTIGIAFYQSRLVQETYTTLGYLVPIITVLSVAIMPRAKYMQTMVMNILGISIGSAVALLGIWSGVQARVHTTPAGSLARYNSSQAAVCAIWLFANIWFVNVLRAKVPALQFPVIMYSIFTNVAFTYGPLFPNIVAGEQLISQLLKGFLTAFAISTGVSLFIFPVSNRAVVFKEQSGYIALCQKTLKTQTAYLQSLETADMFAASPVTDSDDEAKKNKRYKSHPAHNDQAIALNGCMEALIGLHGKLHGDVEFAKREIAWGKLGASEIDEIFNLFRKIMIPLLGMTTITDIFARIAERRGWVEVPGGFVNEIESWEKTDQRDKEEEKRVWNEMMRALHEPFAVCTNAMDEGLQHAALALELVPRAKKHRSDDEEEAKTGVPKPGDPGFKAYLDQRMADFYAKRGTSLKAWATLKGLSIDQFDTVADHGPVDLDNCTPAQAKHRRDQQQLYLILYLENLLYSCGVAISNFVSFADTQVADGKMNKKHLILPGQRRIWKWVQSLGSEDVTIDTESPDSLERGTNTVYLGSGFSGRRDPEHLPPRNAWQRCGNGVRSISHFLGSTESAFGFRVACATMTVGIVAFLEDGQEFFIEQRLVWAMIIIAIGMTMTSGQSIFGFFGRVAGTTIAMISAYIIWYIVDQQTAGVIVMLWLFIFVQMYFFIKFPRFIAIFLVSVVTEVLIIGYELQVRAIGIAAASASGQPYYPTWKLAPYRLACVAGGSFVAFFWTLFPYPLSDRSWLRQDLGTTLFLLANYYSVVHSTISARVQGTEGDMLSSKTSPGKRLEEARHKIFGKLLLLLPSLKQHAEWQRWELSIGGRFPRETYEDITLHATNIMRYLTLMSYATEPWSSSSSTTTTPTSPKPNPTFPTTLSPTTHAITSLLSLLSASVRQGTSLPPYIELQLPASYSLGQRLQQGLRGDGVATADDPLYSAFAVLQVCSGLVTDDLRWLVGSVRDLVGETDFEVRVGSGSEGDGVGRKGKRE